MPLIYDPEYQAELERLRERVDRENGAPFTRWLFFCPALFIALLASHLGGLIAWPALLALSIGLSTFLLGLRLLEICNTINVHMVIQTAAIEWVGRKQLGEYKPPD